MNPTTTSIEIKKKASIKLYKSPRLVQKNKSTEQNQNKVGKLENEKTSKFQINDSNSKTNAIASDYLKNKLSKIKQDIEEKKQEQNANTNSISTNYYKIINKKDKDKDEGLNRNYSNTKTTTTINKVQIVKNINNIANNTKNLNNIQKTPYYTMKNTKSEKIIFNKNNSINTNYISNINNINDNNKKTYQMEYVDKRKHKYTPDKEKEKRPQSQSKKTITKK